MAESEQLMVWPVLALVGFTVLMALIIALGTRSTKAYERAGGTIRVAPSAAQSDDSGRIT